MKKETELTFTRTGEKWQRTGSESTRWQEGSEGRRQAGSGGNRWQQAVSESTRVGVVAWAQLRRKGGMEGGKEEGSRWSDTQTHVG